MPNWCSNVMVVYGSPTEVKDFYDKVKKAWSIGDENKHWHLWEIYQQFGHEDKEMVEYIRGYFEDITSIKGLSPNESCFKLYYESAWSPMIDGFDWILKTYYKTLKQETLAEECGCDIYVNTDTSRRFFKEKYSLYIEDYDTFYCASDEELVKEFNKFSKQKAKNAKDCFDIVEKNDGSIISTIKNVEHYVSLNEFGTW